MNVFIFYFVFACSSVQTIQLSLLCGIILILAADRLETYQLLSKNYFSLVFQWKIRKQSNLFYIYNNTKLFISVKEKAALYASWFLLFSSSYRSILFSHSENQKRRISINIRTTTELPILKQYYYLMLNFQLSVCEICKCIVSRRSHHVICL